MTGQEGELQSADWDWDEPDDFWFEEETEAEARERMSPDELAADLVYEEQRCEACGAAWKRCGC